MGYTCILAHDGAEAMAAAFGQSRFDFIITDLSMPKVDGETLAQCIKSVPGKNQPTPIVAVSAYDMDHLPDSIFDARLSKPVRQIDLIRVLRTLRRQGKISCRCFGSVLCDDHVRPSQLDILPKLISQ